MKNSRLPLSTVPCLCIVSLILLSLPAAANAQNIIYKPNDDVFLRMTYSQACKIIESKNNLHEPVYTIHNLPGHEKGELIRNIEISSDKVTWIDDVENGIFYLNTAYFKSMKINVEDNGGKYIAKLGYGTWKPHGGNWTPTVREIDNIGFWHTYSKEEAVSLANAFYVLKRQADGYSPGDEAASFAAFQDRAKVWRTLTVKPELPEAAQRFRVVAEDAFNNKDFEKALIYYEKGLVIEPLWPQGQFNAALLAGELRAYGTAAAHMKRYLELVPGAPNAKAAREKMYLWEEKAKEAKTE